MDLKMCCSVINITLFSTNRQTKTETISSFCFQKSYEKISFAIIDKSFSFSPKKPFQILAESRQRRDEAHSANLHFPN